MDASLAPWNKGRAQGQKRSLTPAQVGVVKEVLGTSRRLRDLALFSLALDTLLRASDLLALRVSDVQDAGGAIRSTLAIKQQKTSQSLAVTLGDGTRATLAGYILESGKGAGDCLFTSARSALPLTRRHYGRLVKEWAGLVGIQDTAAFSTHSLRRTRAAFIYEQTKDLEVVRQVLGHKSLAATQAYLGVNEAKAHDIAGKYRL